MSRQRQPVAEITHDLGIGAHLGKGVEIRFSRHPQDQPIGLQSDHELPSPLEQACGSQMGLTSFDPSYGVFVNFGLGVAAASGFDKSTVYFVANCRSISWGNLNVTYWASSSRNWASARARPIS